MKSRNLRLIFPLVGKINPFPQNVIPAKEEIQTYLHKPSYKTTLCGFYLSYLWIPASRIGEHTL